MPDGIVKTGHLYSFFSNHVTLCGALRTQFCVSVTPEATSAHAASVAVRRASSRVSPEASLHSVRPP